MNQVRVNITIASKLATPYKKNKHGGLTMGEQHHTYRPQTPAQTSWYREYFNTLESLFGKKLLTVSLCVPISALTILAAFKLEVSTLISLVGIVATVYLACYLIAWAKYEFHITRDSHAVSVLAALCATDKRKSFAPALATLTHKQLPKYPTLFTPRTVFDSLRASHNGRKELTEPNRDTINMVAKIILGFEDWDGATFTRIRLDDCDLSNINLSGTTLMNIDFTGSILFEADLRGANLSDSTLARVDLTGAKLDNANLFGAVLSDSDSWCCATEDIKEYVELLSNVKTLYLTKLPPDVEAILHRERPHLFENTEND